MGVLDGVKALREKSNEKHGFFSTLPGIIAAMTALVTACVSLFNSCNSANKAVLERMDKVEQMCQTNVAVERSAREKADTDQVSKLQEIKDDNLNTRQMAWEYYRKLEQRVLDLEPAGKRKK